MSKDSNRDYQEIANQIGLATYGGVAFQANPEYVEQIGKIFHQELQKARQDWLREEIVKLEGMKLVARTVNQFMSPSKYNSAIKNIIDRYHSELDQDNSKT